MRGESPRGVDLRASGCGVEFSELKVFSGAFVSAPKVCGEREFPRPHCPWRSDIESEVGGGILRFAFPAKLHVAISITGHIQSAQDRDAGTESCDHVFNRDVVKLETRCSLLLQFKLVT